MILLLFQKNNLEFFRTTLILVGPNIQYHIGSGPLKTAETTNVGGPTSTVQYTTSKQSTKLQKNISYFFVDT